MSKHVYVAIAVIVLGLLAIVGVRYVGPMLKDAMQKETSDAAALRGRIRVGAVVG